MSNTPIVFTDFSRFFYDYIKHTNPWTNLLKSVEAIGVLDIVMKKPAEVSRRGECV
jgi:hypothetical protein